MELPILGTCSFVWSVVIGALLCGQNLPKRRTFWIRCILLSVIACSIFYFSDVWIRALPIPSETIQSLRLMECLLLFMITVVLVLLVFQCRVQEAMFCATVGYCMEHIAHEICSVTKMLIPMPFPADTVFLILVTAAFYCLINKYGLKHTDPGKIVKDSPMQFVAFFATTLAAIFLNSIAENLAVKHGMDGIKLCIAALSMLACGMILFLEFYFLQFCDKARERDVLASIIRQEAVNYNMEKSAVELINIKCHDMKHQLRVIEGQIAQGNAVQVDFGDLKKAIYAYDTAFHTGNRALDTMISMKSMICEAKKISFTCLADGRLLNFLSESDVYSLIGNILDNAIEACEAIQEEDRRVVSLNIYETNGIVTIDAMNYFNGTLETRNGLPVTNKADKDYHGFGMLSIKRLVEKYDGAMEIRVENGVFSLCISFFSQAAHETV